MNKIPFTSQNLYAFYAKTIDGYDTETNTRGKKEKKIRHKSLLKRTDCFLFFFSFFSCFSLLNGKHLFG